MSGDTKIQVTFPDGSTSTVSTSFFTLVCFGPAEGEEADSEGRVPLTPTFYQFPGDKAGFTMEAIRACAVMLENDDAPHLKALGRALGRAMHMGEQMIDSALDEMSDNLQKRVDEGTIKG